MRIVLGILSGIVGMIAGWFGLAMLVISTAGFDRDGGIAMGAFFQIGPIGGLVGFAAGVWLFVKVGLARARGAGRRISRPFAIAILAIVGGLAWLTWYELIRSPYLSHGYMTLTLQFRLPAKLAAPAEAGDIGINLDEGARSWPAYPSGDAWLKRDGDRAVILASVSMMYKTSQRVVTFAMPGAPPQSWTLDLANDPDPMPGHSGWLPSSRAPDAIELNYQLTADR
jgi:hypothetical protein